MLRCTPGPRLAPFVSVLWASSGDHHVSAHGARELVLPTGAMHIAIRITDDPLRVFDDLESDASRRLGCALVGGARASAYVRESRRVCTVGAQLRPGASALLLGAPADVVAGRHTDLTDLWGEAAVREARERLAEAPTLPARLVVFESLIGARAPRVRGLHPTVAEALARFATDPSVGAAVVASGYSHRRFGALFREAVGLPPKLFCRVRRFASVLEPLREAQASSSAALALAAGYSDQAHFNRDFRQLAGLTPGRYRALAPTFAHHVRVPMERPR